MSTPEKDALPVTAACARCGHSIYLTGYIWLHANGLLFCYGADQSAHAFPPGKGVS